MEVPYDTPIPIIIRVCRWVLNVARLDTLLLKHNIGRTRLISRKRRSSAEDSLMYSKAPTIISVYCAPLRSPLLVVLLGKAGLHLVMVLQFGTDGAMKRRHGLMSNMRYIHRYGRVLTLSRVSVWGNLRVLESPQVVGSWGTIYE